MDESDGTTVDLSDAATEQVEVAHVLPGDDITVIPDPHDGSNRRRAAWIAGAVAAIVVLAGAVVLVTRDDDPNAAVATDTPTSAAETPNAAATAKPKVDTPKATTVPTQAVLPSTASAPVPVPPVAVAPPVVPPVVPPAVTPTIVPAPASTSAIEWTAPKSVTIKTGKAATIAIVAHNPAAGVITLPTPLSCAPTLDNSGMCTQVAQEIAPGQSASAQWTVSAEGIAPGNYTLNYAGLLKIPVTVTA